MSYKQLVILLCLSLCCFVTAQDDQKRSFAEQVDLNIEDNEFQTNDPTYDQVFVVTDEVRGFTISLENVDGHTIITNLETGEKVIEEGEFAHEMTNEKYTQILDEKESRSGERSEDTKGSSSGSWTATTTFETFTSFFNGGTTASSSIKGTLGTTPGGSTSLSETLYITLYRVIDFWPDKSYGKKSMVINQKSSTTKSFSWSSLMTGAYYYLLFEKSYTGRSSWGTWTLVN